MDNAQKAIMIGVGLFITIIIISAVLLIVNLGTGLVDDATAELGTMATTLQSQILQTYDGKIVSGTQVKAATNRYANDAALCVVLCKKGSTDIVARTGAAYVQGITGTIGGTDVTLKKDAKSVDLPLLNWNVETTIGGKKVTPIRTSASDFSNSLDTTGVYINTAKNYNASVIRNSNDAVVGIVFQPAD